MNKWLYDDLSYFIKTIWKCYRIVSDLIDWKMRLKLIWVASLETQKKYQFQPWLKIAVILNGIILNPNHVVNLFWMRFHHSICSMVLSNNTHSIISNPCVCISHEQRFSALALILSFYLYISFFAAQLLSLIVFMIGLHVKMTKIPIYINYFRNFQTVSANWALFIFRYVVLFVFIFEL